LKEALRLTFRAISGSPEKGGRSFPLVKTDSFGFPTIIPLKLRISLRDPRSNVMVTRMTLTILSIFRVFNWHPKPDLSSITDAHTGEIKTLPNEEINLVTSRLFLGNRLRWKSFVGFISESAGPNGNKATWSSGLDALAFIHYPRNLYFFLKIGLITRSYGYISWILIVLLLASPLYYFLFIIGLMKRLHLGRLSTVYDQAGKARIVGIANWWVQLALKPLHTEIFKLLKTLPMDGTFDQIAPLAQLVNNCNKGHRFYSFDLSSATDRLPIDCQVQVLNSLGIDGSLWKGILDYPWAFKNNLISYSVGQPMGAYSSWAMLALTHHVIVQVAALRANKVVPFEYYAVLGDDVVINDNQVADQYLILMESLGLKINLSKTIISNDFIEFAKRFITPEVDFSPIGAGNILSFMRKPVFISSLLKELYLKGYILSSDSIRSLISSLSPVYQKKWGSLILWTSQSVIGFLTTLSPDILLRKEPEYSYDSSPRRRESLDMRLAYFDSVWNQIREDIQNAAEQIDFNQSYFYRNWYKATCAKQVSYRLIECLLVLWTPGFWLYALSFDKAREICLKQIDEMYGIEPGTLHGAKELLRLNPSTGLDLNWKDRKMVSRFDARFRAINFDLWRLRSKYQSDPNLFTRARNFEFEWFERVALLAHSTGLRPWDLCESSERGDDAA